MAHAQTPRGWPRTEYALAAGMPDGDLDPTLTGLGWRGDHALLIDLVERAALRNGFRKPEYLVFHCPGVCPLIGGQRRFVFNGFELAITGTAHLGGQTPPTPRIVTELRLWGDLARRHGMRAWIYLGQLTHPSVEAYRLANPPRYQAMVRWTLQLVRDAGFTGAFIDASGNPQLEGAIPSQVWGPDHPAIQLVVAEARNAGVQLGVEAWPHQRMEPVFGGTPVYLTHDAFESQHPLLAPHRWGQASSAGHRSVVVTLQSGSDLRRLAWRAHGVNGIIGVPYPEWERVAAELTPLSMRGRPVFNPPKR
ncbi:MAG: hypothetical protein ACRCT8_17925 [Lacipirellulaceae bacterium]